MKSNDELVKEFREAYENLPKLYKEREVDRLHAIVHNKKVIVLEDEDIGKVLRFLDIKNLVLYFKRNKGIEADRSILYRVLRGERKLAYGYKIYYDENI